MNLRKENIINNCPSVSDFVRGLLCLNQQF